MSQQKSVVITKDDKSYLPIKNSINTSVVKPEWFFAGKNGTYLNTTLLLNVDVRKDDKGREWFALIEHEEYAGQIGMCVQDVPKEVYEKDKKTKGPILGNPKVLTSEDAPPPAGGWGKGTSSGNGQSASSGNDGSSNEEVETDLPF